MFAIKIPSSAIARQNVNIPKTQLLTISSFKYFNKANAWKQLTLHNTHTFFRLGANKTEPMFGAESQIAFFDYETVNFICYGSCADGSGQSCMGTYSPVTTKNAFWAESKTCQIIFDHTL